MADAKRVNELARWGAANIEANPDMDSLKLHGTNGVLACQNTTGTLPTFNFNAGQLEFYKDIMGETMTDTVLCWPTGCQTTSTRP